MRHIPFEGVGLSNSNLSERLVQCLFIRSMVSHINVTSIFFPLALEEIGGSHLCKEKGSQNQCIVLEEVVVLVVFLSSRSFFFGRSGKPEGISRLLWNSVRFFFF